MFQPKEFAESLYDLDLKRLKGLGLKGLIIDLDDTLVPRNSNLLPPEAISWIGRARQYFSICITSNSLKRPFKVREFARILGVPSLIFAFKPLPLALLYSLKILKTSAKETALIGDQIFSDILGGNLLGLYTILVKYQTPETFWPRKIMRWTESKLFGRIRSQKGGR